MLETHKTYAVQTLCAVLLVAAAPASAQHGAPNGEWPTYGGDLGHTRYAALDQIDADTFNDLELAWRFNTANLGPGPEYIFQSTPLMVNGVLYTTAGTRRAAVALDATTGEMLWIHRLNEGERGAGAPRRLSGRGLTYWDDGDDGVIFYVTPGYRLIALNALTGRRMSDFADEGLLDLKQGLDQDLGADAEIGLHAAPVISNGVIMIGAAHLAGVAPATKEKPKGYVRGFDARSGERKWIFHTIPTADELGNDTWGNDSWRYTGNTGVWGQMTIDEDLGYVYLPIEMPTGDLYGGHRPGDNLFADSIVAIEIATGNRVWHFQTVHHDVWDFDLPSAPILVDITVDGRAIKAVAQPTKMGFLFVLDRTNGEPVWPIEERPVPQSDVPGEVTSATQPFPTKPPPFDRQGVTVDDLIDFTPELRRRAEEVVTRYRMGPLFSPPSVATLDGTLGTLHLPGLTGGSNWPGGSFDPETGIFYQYSKTEVHGLGLVSNPERSNMDYIMGRPRPPAGAAGGRGGRGGRWIRWYQHRRHHDRQTPMGADHRHRPEPGGNRVAGGARRDPGQHSKSPAARGHRCPAYRGRECPHRHAGHQDTRHRRRRRLVHERGGSPGLRAPRVRQGYRRGSGHRGVTGPGHGVADDLPGRRRAVSGGGDRRWWVRGRAVGVQSPVSMPQPGGPRYGPTVGIWMPRSVGSNTASILASRSATN